MFISTAVPPILQRYFLKRQKGSALFAVVIILSVISSVFAVSISKATHASLNASRSDSIALNARNIASSEAELIRATNYSALASISRSAISNSAFEREVIVSNERSYNDTINQRTVQINVYRTGETTPRAATSLVRYSGVTGAGSTEEEPDDKKSIGVPIGTVIIWASSGTPIDNGTWLECNGQSCSSYPALAAVLGKSTVPDYRGMFLRGHGSQSFTQYNGAIPGSSSVNYSSGSLGAIQGDATRQVSGGFSVASSYAADQEGPFTLADYGVYANGYHVYLFNPDLQLGDWADVGSYYRVDFTFDNSIQVPIAEEIRPVNVAVRYFIKAA